MASHKERIMEDLTPLYNKEFYLAHLCGEDVVLPIPDGNAERYLAYLCGMDVTIPDVPDGRTETYLAYKCGEDVVLPDPMYRIEYYLAKWCGIDCEVPEPMYRIEYWLAQLANSGELKTVSGNPISVSDALARPAESLVIEILPQQSGSGDPSPDNVRPITGYTGVNIYRESAYDPDADPTYSISWQDEAGTVYGGELDVTNGVLTVNSVLEVFDSVLQDGNIISNIGLDYLGTSGSVYDIGDVVRISFAIYGNTSLYNRVSSGYAYKMCNMAKHYFAYNDTSVHWYRNTVLYLFLPKAVCGSTASEVRDYLISIKDTNPLSLWIPLVAPQTYQLTPTEVQMLLGNNTLWNDINGDMTLEYLADGPTDDIDALQILLGNRYVNNGGPDEATDKEALEILLGGNTR